MPEYKTYRIEFTNEKDRTDFKNKAMSLKIKSGKSIPEIATEALNLYGEMLDAKIKERSAGKNKKYINF